MKSGIMLALAAMVFCVAGCSEDRKNSSIYTIEPAKTIEVSYDANPDASEVDLVEKLAQQRSEYFEALIELKGYYESVGNFRKTQWADRELAMLGEIPQYSFIISGEMTKEGVKSFVDVPAANAKYAEAKELYDKAKFMALIGDKPSLRKALAMFNEIIETWPNSSKADDSAYYAGQIYHFFKDYKLAALYYKRAIQWSPDFSGAPIRYRLASTLDYKLGRRAEALSYYKLALEKESGYSANEEMALSRIKYIEKMRAQEAELN